jgi:DegV family protein with EDD domain
MKIRYLNGRRLYYAFLAGGKAVILDRAFLNKINVFPVPDADTGTNLASTMQAIAEGSEVHHHSIKSTLKSIANAALNGARGNSGLIFAQFIHGMSKEIGSESMLTTSTFGESVRRAAQDAYKAIAHPVEGTMVSVIRDWAEAVYQKRTHTADFVELLSDSLHAARTSLRETTHKLQVLARANVVDAGAKGFVDFLEGVLHFIKKGKLSKITKAGLVTSREEIKAPSKDKDLTLRYCAEALLKGDALDPDAIRLVVQRYGDSAAVAGSEERARIHVHTNEPTDLFLALRGLGTIVQIKVDDMLRQYEAAHARKSEVAILTDSSCDLPPEIFDERQIHFVPLTLSFGTEQYLDKMTITPERFYDLLRTSRVHPQTAVPGLASIQQTLEFLASHYASVIVLTLSGKLSALSGAFRKAAEQVPGKNISVIDTRTLSAGLGLLAAKASEMALAGASHADIVRAVEDRIPKTKLFVDVSTLKYFVRGGRVSPVKGLLGRLLHIKPILVLDEEGKAAEGGKSFSRRGNMAKILKRIRSIARDQAIEQYAVVHAADPERAEFYGRKLTAILGKKPAFISSVAPVIGVHAGTGTVGVCLIHK